MKKAIYILWSIVFIGGIILSCERSEPTTSLATTDQTKLPYQGDVSIEEAKNHFINTVSTETASARKAAENDVQRTIDWDAARKFKQENGLEVIVAPIQYKTKARPGIIFWDDKTPSDQKKPTIENVLDVKESLLSFKDRAGKMQAQLVQYITTKEYKNRKKGDISKDDFSGWVKAMTWDEKFIIGFEFRNGKDVKRLNPASTSGGRTASCDFYYYQNVTANCYSCGSNCTQCDVYINGSYQGTCTDPSSNSGTDGNYGVTYGGSGIGNYTPPASTVDINNSNLRPCMQEIMVDIKKLANGNIGNIIKVFSNNDNSVYNWKLLDGNLPPNTNAQTSQRFDIVTKTVTTTFDGQKFIDASDLSIARTIIHESIHAYMINYFRIDPLTANASFPQLMNDYANNRYDGNANAIQHEEFARNYVNEIAIALSEFDILRGYTHPWNFYEDLAWGGLEGTVAFSNLSNQDKNRIRDRVLIELTGKDSNGNPQGQIGRYPTPGCN